MSYSGYDIEDAIVMNRAALDRGFGRCVVLRKYGAQIKKYSNRTTDRIVPPSEEQRRLVQNWASSTAGRDGIAAVGERISPGDGTSIKQSPSNTRDPLPNPQAMPDAFFRPTPQSYKGPQGESCVVDKVMLTMTDEGQFNVKCLVRHTRRPEVGDKFSSRHGQKGVCGTILQQSDFPFSERGVCPDLIMNPHGFPSRMTVGKMIELLGGKAGLEDGRFHDGTAFGGDSVSAISETLVPARVLVQRQGSAALRRHGRSARARTCSWARCTTRS